jgi:putative salt-induced outer membrane protein YdiY
MKHIIFTFIFCLSSISLAEGKWSHESELSIVTISGNSESETTSAKQKTKYAREKDSATITAAYTEAESEDATTGLRSESARNSHLAGRYDRVIDGRLSGFIGHGVYSDRFAGFTQEDRSDLGLSYLISKRDDQEWTLELGYQRSEFNYVAAADDSLGSARLATAYAKKMNESVSAGIKVEYRDAFEDGKNGYNGEQEALYWLDYEANLAVVMTNILSLKIAYESKYQNFRPAGTSENEDTKFTTSLVAKF